MARSRSASQPPANHAPPQVVTYHESCHLAHGQKITAQPRQLLSLIPNLKLVELPESTWCCGSAGIYNIVQPEMANQLLDRKLKHIQSTGATIVANGNSGCLLQLINGAKRTAHEPARRAPGHPAGRGVSPGKGPLTLSATDSICEPKQKSSPLLTNPGIIAVVRAKRAAQVLPLSEALLAGGVMADRDHHDHAQRHRRHPRGQRASSATAHSSASAPFWTPRPAAAAIDAGRGIRRHAPSAAPSLSPSAQTAGRPIMLGAYTPTEAQTAHEAGADFVKIFPADSLGAKYIKALRAPLPHLRIVPTGGVDVKTIADFLKAGCAAVGVGSSLVSANILAKDDWAELTKIAADFVKAAKAARA